MSLWDDHGHEWGRRRSRAVDERELRRERALGPRLALLLWRGRLHVPPGTAPTLNLRADGAAEVWIDGRQVLALRGAERPWGQATVLLEPPRSAQGYEFEVRFRPGPDSRRLRWQLALPAHAPRLIDAGDLSVAPAPGHALVGRLARAAGALLPWAWGAALAGALLLLLARRATGRSWQAAADFLPRPALRLGLWWGRYPGVASLALLALVSLYAAGLRFEALVGRYWLSEAPSWAHRLAEHVRGLRPGRTEWKPAEFPYRGDPWTYAEYARQMRGFYDAHVREPVFVAATRLGLELCGGRRLGVSLAAAAFSLLVVPALYGLGCGLGSRLLGLLAAALWAVEWQVLSLSVEGWRDDAFTFFVTLSAWALLRLRARPGFSSALLAGLVCGLACLTRITSLSFVLPGLLLAGAWPGQQARQRRHAALLALGLAALLLAPYLASCALAFGDPLHSLNAHAQFYWSRVGRPTADPSHGALGWLRSSRGPLEAADMLVDGLTSYPFESKWQGFEDWGAGLGRWLRLLALVGTLLLARRGVVWLLATVYVGAVLPYALTWDIPGGGEWRFTLCAYPFYLLASAESGRMLVAALDPGALGSRLRAAWTARARLARRALLAAAGVALVAAGLAGLRFAAVSELLAAGRQAHLGAGWRSALFFGSGFGWPRRVLQETARPLRSERAHLRLPLAGSADYALTLRLARLTPAATTTIGPLELNLNGRPLERRAFAAEADYGHVQVIVPAALLRPGTAELTLVAPHETLGSLAVWRVSLVPLRR